MGLYGGVSLLTLPIKINNMLLCVGNMSRSAACLMNVGFNAEKNTGSGSWDFSTAYTKSINLNIFCNWQLNNGI